MKKKCQLKHYQNKVQGKKVLMAGFGVGLSWASAIVNFDKNLYCSKFEEYVKGE